MDTSSRIFQPVAIGDTVTIKSINGSVTLRVVGLARTAGSGAGNAESQGSISFTRGYLRARELLQFTRPFPSVAFGKTKPRLETGILLQTRQSSNIAQTAPEVAH